MSGETVKLKKGDRISWPGFAELDITVRRVAKDHSWADLFVYDNRTLTCWTKRQQLPIAGLVLK